MVRRMMERSFAGSPPDLDAIHDPQVRAARDLSLAIKGTQPQRAEDYVLLIEIARACGKSHVHNMEPEDLVALTIEAAAIDRQVASPLMIRWVVPRPTKSQWPSPPTSAGW